MSSFSDKTIDDNSNGDKGAPQYKPQYISGMTPSIITTINNTSPTPLVVNTDQGRTDKRGDSTRPDSGTKNGDGRVVEPPAYYESYIEDSFVGHWEREDDDQDYDNRGSHRGSNDPHRPEDEEEDESMHPSTIEFDFDSFGPESFIYTPAANAASSTTAAANKPTTQPTSRAEQQPSPSPPPLPPQQHMDQSEKDKSPKEDELILVAQHVTTIPVVSVEQREKDQKEMAPTVTAATTASVSPKLVNPPRICQLKLSPVDYLVDPAQIDLKVIEPYKKVISHAGYCHHFDPSGPPPKPGESAPAIIVFSACYLPDRSRRDYDYVMDHLFLYVLSSLHELIADDYILIYLHNTQPSTTNSSLSSSGASSSSTSHSANGTSTSTLSGIIGQQHDQEQVQQNNLPTFTWMKRCYQMIDRKLRKNLKILYLVKPTFWLKTIVIMCRPFISSKFSKKLRFIENMQELRKCLPVDELILPASADCL